MIIRKITSIARGIIWRYKYLFFNRNIVIGKNVRIGRNVYLSARSDGKVVIGDSVVIGSNSDLAAINGGTLQIGRGVGIGDCSKIISHNSIQIGNNTLLAPHVYIYDHNHYFNEKGVDRKHYVTGRIDIGENCWLCINTVILKDTKIGNNCLVGAGAVVKGVYADGSRVIQKR